MQVSEPVVQVRNEDELFARAGHLFAAATEVSCAAETLRTFGTTEDPAGAAERLARNVAAGIRVQKLYQPAVLLEPRSAALVRALAAGGALVRITTAELPETILLDRRVAIVAGPADGGERGFSIVRAPDVVAGLAALLDAAWQAGRTLDDADGSLSTLRTLTPRILDALSAGWTDETAARALNVSVRTYRRRVAELMTALNAASRFQAGVRARELHLV